MFQKKSAELKVLAINTMVVLVATIFTLVSDGAFKDFPLYFGLSALGVGLLNLPIAVVLLVAGNKDYGRAFLISAGILLLVSGISCSVSSTGLFH